MLTFASMTSGKKVNKMPDDTAEFQTWNLPADRFNFFVTAFVFIFCFAAGGGVTWTELGLGYGLKVQSSNPGRGKRVFSFLKFLGQQASYFMDIGLIPRGVMSTFTSV